MAHWQMTTQTYQLFMKVRKNSHKRWFHQVSRHSNSDINSFVAGESLEMSINETRTLQL